MQVQKIDNSVYCGASAAQNNEHGSYSTLPNNNLNNSTDSVSFKGNGIPLSKRFWLNFRKLSDYMKEPNEMTNAAIAAIGTGAIAPIAIMCSPKKETDNEKDEKAAMEKKFFQAVRQPVSALLAFGFQVPTTIGIAKAFNHYAYEKQAKFFNDEVLGTLIPDKKYLKKQALKALKENASPELKQKWAEELKLAGNFEAIKPELIAQIKRDYEEVGIEISEQELEKLASKESTKTKFIAEKMAEAKHESYLLEKIKELTGKEFKITELDLVTEKYQDLAKIRYKEDFAALEKEANLSWADRLTRAMGISNEKLSKLNAAEKKLSQEKGLEIIRQEIAENKIPDIFNDPKAQLKKFIENRDVKAQKLYGNKIFWLSLVANLFMVGISCVALNWLHPKFADFIDKIRHKYDDDDDDTSNTKKVEVDA